MGNEYSLPIVAAGTGAAPQPMPYPQQSVPQPQPVQPMQPGQLLQAAQQSPIDPMQVALMTGFAIPPNAAAGFSRLIRAGAMSRLIAKPPAGSRLYGQRQPLQLADPMVRNNTSAAIRADDPGMSQDLSDRLADAAIQYVDSPFRKYAERENAAWVVNKQDSVDSVKRADEAAYNERPALTPEAWKMMQDMDRENGVDGRGYPLNTNKD